MKAAVIDRFGGPEEIYYTDIEKPVPGPDEVLVKNVYIGVGKPDYIMRSGICPFLEAKPPKLVVGNECAGIVEAVGADVKGIEPGMHVCVNSGLGYGAYAEYIAVPQKFVTVFPDEFPLKYAPGFLNYMVAYALLNEIGRGTDGKSIYIYGAAGGVNCFPSSRQLKKYKFFLPAEIYLLAVFMQLASKFRVFPLVLKFRDSFASVYCCSNLYNLRSFLREYLYQ